MSTQRPPGTGRRTAVQRTLSNMRQSARKTLEPLLKPATQEAVLALEFDLSQSSSLKGSARNILVGYRAFSDAFFAALDKEMDAAVSDLLDGREAPAKPARGRNLSLVDYDQMEEQTMVDRVAARLRNAADSEYVPLTQRIARAVRVPGLGDRENPFHPLRYCRALGSAIDKLGFKGEERQAIIRAFEVPLQKPLVELYSALNKRLEQQGVSDGEAPRFSAATTGVRVPAAGTAGAMPPHAPVAGSAAGAAATVGPTMEPAQASGPASGTTAEQLLTALFARLQSRTAGGLAGAVPAVPRLASVLDHPDTLGPTTLGFAGSIPVAPVPAAVPLAPDSAAAPIAPGVPVQFAAIDPALLASINEVQRLNALATMTGRSGAAAPATKEQDEHHLRQRVAEKATRQVDKLTVELVGMVFDRIHQDDHIPAQVRIALSRLQFPIMKVALADADLFVSASQPARRLMDRIASTAIGWHPEGDENARYLAEVNRAINTVLLAVNEGPAIFETALDEFEKFLAEERGREDDPVTRARRALEEAEKREAMAINAAVGIRRACDEVEVEPYLREFLLDVWVKVLVAATLRERTEPDFARRYRDAVSDLIWSVQPKFDPDDRKRLVKTIPAVLNTLREGLQLIDVSFSGMRPFFTRLMASHAHAVKAGETASGIGTAVDQSAIRRKVDEVPIEAPPAEEPEQPLAISAEMLRDAVAANHAEVNLLEEAADDAPGEMIPVDQLSDDAIDAMIDGWQRGAWFDLWTGEETERVRLRWVSPRRHFYLFTSAESGRAHSIPPSILRGYVRGGRIKPAEKAPLFERVVDHLLRDLQGEGAALAV